MFEVMTDDEIRAFVRHVIEHGDGGEGAIRAIHEKWIEDRGEASNDAYGRGVHAGQESCQ